VGILGFFFSYDGYIVSNILLFGAILLAMNYLLLLFDGFDYERLDETP
jgi:hypothetical protein